LPLVLEIEHLLGVSFAAQSPASAAPDWPPQPDRVFSALVASWGARGCRKEEEKALQWLEQQRPPEIVASGGWPRSPAIAYVPPNDNEVPQGAVSSKWFEFLTRGERPPKKGGYEKSWRNALGVVPTERARAARRFPAFRPDDPIVRLVWRDVQADSDTMAALNALAKDTASIGHSSSLTRCRFHADAAAEPGRAARRRVYPGRLEELKRNFDARPQRRPGPGETVRAGPLAAAEPARSMFADRWLVLEHVDGEMPDVRAAALVAKALRNVLMSGYRQSGQEASIPSLVCGHAPDGKPTAEPHLAIVPLAFLGAEHADGHVMGLALIPPGTGELLDDADFQKAVRSVAPWNNGEGRRELKLDCSGFNITFSLSSDGTRYSLRPEPYTAASRTWATCTPIVLDRHLKAKGNAGREAEIGALLRQACVNIGLPEPERVAVGKHSAVRAAPAAYPSGHAPRWMRWRLPESLASRQLTHAVLQFAEPVRGPVLLGAGRFAGLGLCRALDPKRRA
jgi:CRISPR-associated protein Csb2